jgi:hypothetical protein
MRVASLTRQRAARKYGYQRSLPWMASAALTVKRYGLKEEGRGTMTWVQICSRIAEGRVEKGVAFPTRIRARCEGRSLKTTTFG